MSNFEIDPKNVGSPKAKAKRESPVQQDANLMKISSESRMELLKSHIDEGKAKRLIQRLDGSADDYERNMVRIDQWLMAIQQVLGSAIHIAPIA